MRFHSHGILQGTTGSGFGREVAVLQLKKSRGDFGIEIENPDGFACPKFERHDQVNKMICPWQNLDPIDPLVLKNFHRLLGLYAIGLGLASASFMIELIMTKCLITNCTMHK